MKSVIAEVCRPMNRNREPLHSRVRLTVSACYGHAACGPNSASPAPLGPLCVRPVERVRVRNGPLRSQGVRRPDIAQDSMQESRGFFAFQLIRKRKSLSSLRSPSEAKISTSPESRSAARAFPLSCSFRGALCKRRNHRFGSSSAIGGIDERRRSHGSRA